MTAARALSRLHDIKISISAIKVHLADRTVQDLQTDIIALSAFERLLEVISEASRRVPMEWKSGHPDIPWRNIGDLGNHLRHAYQRTNLSLLWEFYERDLDPLERAIDAMLAAHDK